MKETLIQVEIEDNYLGGEVEKSRSRMRLCSEILQCMRKSGEVAEILETVVSKLLNFLNVVHVSVYKLSAITDTVERMSGRIVAEAIAPNCDACAEIHLENILNDEYAWIQSSKREILDLYAAGLTRCEINLTEIFAGKAYLLVPIVLGEGDREDSLWGFLTVHNCLAANSEPFKGAWDQDDVLMLQQIAMQIEIMILNANAASLRRQAEIKLLLLENTNEEWQCAEEGLKVSNLDLIEQNHLLQYEQFRYQNLFDVAPNGYLVTDSTGKIMEANQAILDLLGMSHKSIIGKPFVVFVASNHIDLDKLFKSFSQANHSIARQYGGTGLGLVICKQLCELMGGEISVNSTIGEGSTFSFSIMANARELSEDSNQVENQTKNQPKNISASEAIAPNLTGKHILVICNNRNIGQAIAMYAKAWQISTQIAESGSDAMLLFESANFDAVLIDENLVDMDALELADDIHQIFPALKLVLLTFPKTNVNAISSENASENVFEKAKRNAAFAAYINKPITSSKLHQTLINIFYPEQAKLISDEFSSTNIIPANPESNINQEIPLSVLIVEDNLVNQQLLLKMLKKLGYRAKAVDNGLKGVEAVTEKPYEIIFMDLQMPIMDGLIATTHIRQLPNRQPWIIGLSANSFVESQKSALAVGMDEYLSKPLLPEDLVAALNRVPKTFIKEVSQEVPKEVLQISPEPATEITLPKPNTSSINLAIFSSIENSVGKENLSEVIDNYFNQAEREIANMRAAFNNQDIVTLEANNHSLKGGSGLFGATKLLKFCRSLQFMCRICIESNQYAIDDIDQIGVVLQNVEEEYKLVKQALKALQ